MKEETNDTEATVEERGGFYDPTSNDITESQYLDELAQISCGILSTDTTFDTTAPRPWTPGPWQEGRSDMASIVEGYESKYIRSQHPDYHLTDVAIASGREVSDWETVMANARLIAAAPDLFEALAEAVRMYGSDGGPWNVPSHPGSWIAQARAAMDKALGVDMR